MDESVKTDAKGERFEKFTALILGLNRSIQRIKSEEMIGYGLKCVHVNCLYYLGKSEGGLSQAELVRLCGEDKGYISRAVDKLCKLGFATVCGERAKRYNAAVVLTESGKTMAGKVYKMADRAVAAGSAGLTDGDREVFYRCLESVNRNLEKYKVPGADLN